MIEVPLLIPDTHINAIFKTESPLAMRAYKLWRRPIHSLCDPYSSKLQNQLCVLKLGFLDRE